MFIKNSEETTGKEYILDKPETPSSFLQFIPATVHQVINSGESIASPTNNDNESNCIIVEKNILTDDVTLNGVDSRKIIEILFPSDKNFSALPISSLFSSYCSKFTLSINTYISLSL